MKCQHDECGISLCFACGGQVSISYGRQPCETLYGSNHHDDHLPTQCAIFSVAAVMRLQSKGSCFTWRW